MNSPCYGCQQRAIGCHGQCELYKDWCEKKQQVYQERCKSLASNRRNISGRRNRVATIVEKQIRRNYERMGDYTSEGKNTNVHK
jgi:hypothetical protein